MIANKKSLGMTLVALAWAAACSISDAVVSVTGDASTPDAAAGASGTNAKNSGGATTSSGGMGSGGRSAGGVSASGGAGARAASSGGADASASAGGTTSDSGVGGLGGGSGQAGTGGASGDGSVGAGGDAGAGGRGNGGTAGAGGLSSGGSGGVGTGGRSGTGGVGTGGRSGTGGAPGTGGAVSLCPRLDCSNPNCVDDVCVDGAPVGWTGPIALYEGDPSSTPACAAPYSSLAFTVNASLAQEPAQCSACTGCNLVSSPVCGAYGAPSYSGGCPDPGQLTCLSVCTSFANVYQSISWNSPWISPQGCAPATKKPTPTLPPPHWGTTARGCALPFPGTNGCSPGSICAPVPKAPLNGKLCIYQDGDVACPSPSLYSSKRLYYATATDQRDCGNCTCKFADPQPSCVGTVTVFSDTNCQNVSYTSGPGCTTAAAGSCKGNFTVVNANCANNPAGGQPTGTIDPAGPVTICCSP